MKMVDNKVDDKTIKLKEKDLDEKQEEFQQVEKQEEVSEEQISEATDETTEDVGEQDMSFADELKLEEAKAKEAADKQAAKELKKNQNNLYKINHSDQPAARFEKLDNLLNQIEMYTQFLKEYLPEAQPETDLDALPEESGNEENIPVDKGVANDGKKRKRKTKSEEAENSNKARRLSISVKLAPEDLPLFKGDLRDYQVVGVHWLISLYHNGMNGILADQMGLGKTIQTIAFFSYLRSMKVFGPFMVVAPLSTVFNWKLEFEKFCPEQPTVIYHGAKDERESIRRQYSIGSRQRGNVGDQFPLFITSFEMIRMDRKCFQSLNFKYVVVDEGHKLKNHQSQLTQEMLQLNIDNRLILTGTPLQNHVTELWSLLNFVMPDAFPNLNEFEAMFDFSSIGTNNEDIVQQERRNQVITKLHKILDPFILRRVKKVAAPDLPPKQDIVLYAPMTQKQIEMTQDCLNGDLTEKLEAEFQCKNRANRSLKYKFMQLRKIANHPDLILGDYCSCRLYPPISVLLEQCGKLQLLDRLLDKLFAKGHKVIIFSQFVIMLDVLHYYFEEKKIRVGRLDGQIKFQDRVENIKSFYDDPDMKVFLLSTRAGGLGINLTVADTVIVYDSDWNPQADLQAQDRCHRIGQTKPVLVLRLATSYSVEIRMLQRASEKLTLERLLIKNGKKDEVFTEIGAKSLSEEQLIELLQTDIELCKEAQEKPVSEEMLDRILERDYVGAKKLPFPKKGAGYEMLEERAVSGLQQQK
eukprot:TRINITY_DN19362_c0_g4_i2.p1 TRINITY_DN19362_c0_g4~~TRINITY_DN19362_c0_g4_i2.p1  ORF type:complete len:851 (+),score=164.48 TRINITY_DN19362_c0_g4_i2:299-2554(+)